MTQKTFQVLAKEYGERKARRALKFWHEQSEAFRRGIKPLSYLRANEYLWNDPKYDQKVNPHKSFSSLNAKRARAEAVLLSKANKHYARAAQLEKQGKPLQARTEATKGRILAQRAHRAGTYTDGPVGRLPNPTKAALKVELAQVDRDIAELETDPFYRETTGRRAYARKWLAHHRRQRREIERLLKRATNGIVDIAAGMQALDYLGRTVKGKRNPETVKRFGELAIGESFRLSRGGKIHKKETASTALTMRARHGRDVTERLVISLNRAVLVVKKRKQKNPSVTTLSKTFQGEVNGAIDEYYASDAAPKNLARAGKLVFLKVAGRSLRLPGAMVAIAPNNKLWITGKQPLFATKAKSGEGLDMGEVSHICYETAKSHLEDGKLVEWVHEFGEDGGRRPHLIIDHEGMPILRGGDYTIKAEGIVN